MTGDGAAAYVVEDNEAYRELLTVVVQDHCGLDRVRAYGDGTSAIAAFAAASPAERPGVVLLDFHMPGPTGLAVLRSLRLLGFRGQAVVISNAASLHERQACEDEGACVLDKPARYDELIASLSAVVVAPPAASLEPSQAAQ